MGISFFYAFLGQILAIVVSLIPDWIRLRGNRSLACSFIHGTKGFKVFMSPLQRFSGSANPGKLGSGPGSIERSACVMQQASRPAGGVAGCIEVPRGAGCGEKGAYLRR